MADDKGKILSYRRAEWFTQQPSSYSLERAVRDAHKKLTTVSDRTIVRESGQHVKSAKFEGSREHGVLIHLTADTPGELASIVPISSINAINIDVGTTAAPPDNEFMDGDCFLYIRDDHVTLCTTGMRDGGIKAFLYEFFRKANIRADADKFDLVKIANLDKIKLIRSQGVKEIELRATMYAATASYQRRQSQVQGLLGTVSRHFKKLIGSPHDVTDDSLRIALSIKSDGRGKNLRLGEKRLEKIAEGIIEEQEGDDAFTIHTVGDQKIGPNELYVRRPVHIDRKGKSVDRDKAWSALVEFYQQLVELGAIET